MKVKTNKPYFYFDYKNEPGGLAYSAVLLNIVTRRFKHLINFDLQDDKELRRYSMPLQHLMNSVDLSQRVNRLDQLLDQLEVAFDLVNRSLKINAKETCVAYEQVAERLSEYEEEVHYSREVYYKAMSDKDSRPIKKFKSMFDYYQELYKDYYSIISAFPAFCHGIMIQDSRSINEYLKLESKEKVEILSSTIILNKVPISLLTKGCDRHIRNAISHENRHSFLENNTKVRLTDVNPRGNITYDRTFTLKEFEEILRDLMITIQSLKTVLIVFNINNISEINTYLPKKLFSPDDIEKIAFISAKDSFLDYQSMNLNGLDDVRFIVKVQERRKVKSMTVRAGPFSQTVTIPEISAARQQLARFLQLVYHYTGKTFKRMSVSLIDLDDELIGELQINTVNFNIKDVDMFLSRAIKNTVPENYKLEK